MKIVFGNLSGPTQPTSVFTWFKDLFIALKPPIGLKQFSLATGFFLGITAIRWLFRAQKKNEYDTYDEEEMVKICKFCQIRQESIARADMLVY